MTYYDLLEVQYYSGAEEIDLSNAQIVIVEEVACIIIGGEVYKLSDLIW